MVPPCPLPTNNTFSPNSNYLTASHVIRKAVADVITSHNLEHKQISVRLLPKFAFETKDGMHLNSQLSTTIKHFSTC